MEFNFHGLHPIWTTSHISTSSYQIPPRLCQTTHPYLLRHSTNFQTDPPIRSRDLTLCPFCLPGPICKVAHILNNSLPPTDLLPSLLSLTVSPSKEYLFQPMTWIKSLARSIDVTITSFPSMEFPCM